MERSRRGSSVSSLDEASEEAVAAGERAIASLVRQLEVTGPGNSTAQQQQQATQPAQPPQPPQQQQQQPPQEYRSTRGSFVLPQRALPSSVGVIQEEQGGEGDEPVSPLLAAATGRPLAMAHVDEAPALGVGGVGAGVGAGAGAGATVGVPTGAAMQQSAAGGTLRRQHGSNPILFPELGIRHSRSQVLMLESNVEEQFLSRLSRHMYSPSRDAASPRRSVSHDSATEDNTFDFASAIPLMAEGVAAVVDDSFTHCFEENPPQPWNWNIYLFPMWLAGIVIRYFILFPLRLLVLILGSLIFFICFPLCRLICKGRTRVSWEQSLIQFFCSVFVMSWSGVIKFHGSRPTQRPGEPGAVFVANHSSMIDFIILQQTSCYAVLGQKHKGWVGFLQELIVSPLQCVWFDRSETKNRQAVANKLRDHVADGSRCPLLVFPEGTCVNNRYVMQFKKSVFDLGARINPIAIKYNPIFVDGYWHSRKVSFARHLFNLMTSWAVVCDVWFLDPQEQQTGEDAAAFAKRVQDLIADTAGLKSVDWDGYMKYWAPSKRFIKARQADFTATLVEASQVSAMDAARAAVAAGPRAPRPLSMAPPPRMRRRHTQA